jgi:hypothetical protein
MAKAHPSRQNQIYLSCLYEDQCALPREPIASERQPLLLDLDEIGSFVRLSAGKARELSRLCSSTMALLSQMFSLFGHDTVLARLF